MINKIDWGNGRLEVSLKKRIGFKKKFYNLNLPIFISQLLLVIVGILNSLMFGQLGERVLAAVAIVDKINGVYWPVLTAISTIISIYLLQNNESNNKREIKKIFMFSNLIMIGISVIALLIITIGDDTLVNLYSKDKNVLGDAKFYLWAIGIANMFATISYSIITYFNGLGKVKETSVVGIFQTIINFILYYLFIIKTDNGFFLGIRGIAFAIIITKILELIFYLKIYKTKFSLKEIKIDFSEGFDKKLIKDISSYMTPLVLNNIFFMIATNMIFLSFSKKGTMETAAVGITDSLIGYFYLLMQGIITSTKIMIGGLLGKNEMRTAEIYSKRIIKIMLIATSITAVAINLLANIYLRFYKIDPYTMKLSLILIFIASIIFIPKMLNALVVDGVLRIGGDIKKAIVNDMIGIFGFGVGLSLIFTKVIEVNIILLYILVNSNEIVRFILNYRRYRKKAWLRKTI